MRKERSNGTGTQDRSAPRVSAQIQASGRGKRGSGRKTDPLTGRFGLAVLLSRIR
jgi:hypothetical protein